MRKLIWILLCGAAMAQGVVVTAKTKLGPKVKISPGGAGGGGATSNCGYSPATPASTDSNALQPLATPCTTGTNSGLGFVVNSVSWYAQNAGADTVDLGVYTSTGTGGTLAPSTLVCHTGTTAITASIGYNTLAITGCGTLTDSTSYWVAMIDTSRNYGYDAGNCPGFSVPMKGGTAQGSALLPGTFPSPSGFGECQAQYMTVTAN